jgi:hypothetical protein
MAAMLALIGGAGCNGPLSFHTFMNGTGGGIGPTAGSGGTAGNRGIGGSGTGGQNPGSGGVIVPPPDAGPDLAVDMGGRDTGGQPDVPTAPDVRPDIVEAPQDRPPEVAGEAGVDANNPVVCTTDTQCRFPTLPLHCFIAGGQTSGSCVECTGDGDCTTPGLRRCDTMAGSTTFHRCVECMNGTVNTDCPSLSTEHPSACNNEHHCLQGCSDDPPVLACTKPGFDCQSSGGSEPDHQCADCLAQADCTAPLRCINFVCLQCTLNTDCAAGQFCDNVAGRCVACRDSADCRAAGLRLCSPATHVCVASN